MEIREDLEGEPTDEAIAQANTENGKASSTGDHAGLNVVFVAS
jgi:hypothetical protein